MRVLIDLIEDIREEIGNEPDFTVHAMLLKVDAEDKDKLINSGETALHAFDVDVISRQLLLKLEKSDVVLTMGDLLKHLLILDMDAMMYEVKLYINESYPEVEVLGFGKSIEEKKYFFFIKL